jgi:hypothetical protein
LAKRLGQVWGMATSEDFRFPTTLGKVPLATRIGHRYLDQLIKLVAGDAGLARTVSRVFQLLDPPANLVRPGIAVRVLARALRG